MATSGYFGWATNLIIVFVLVPLLSGSTTDREGDRFFAHRIAHAGGAVNGHINLNSIEALEKNIGRGFRYFELDLVFTEDNKVVCLRNWSDDFFSAFKFYPGRRLKLDEFVEMIDASDGRSRRCDQNSLLEWVKKNPSAKIVTDFKERNLLGLLLLSKVFPKSSILPQIYEIEDYSLVRDLGYRHIIWTLYRSSLTDEEVFDRVSENPAISAVTMPEFRARRGLALRLSEIGVPTYVHTINSVSNYDHLRLQAVTEVYSDTLYPDIYPQH